MSEEIYKILIRKSGFRVTEQRVQILRALAKSSKPMSASAVRVLLGHRRAADQATIYRTLSDFSAAGLVRPVDLRHDHMHFEIADDDHHHLICLRCGRTEDFTGCRSRTLIKSALRQSRYFKSVRQHSIELYGVCINCDTVKPRRGRK